MKKTYFKQDNPARISTLDGGTIEEHFGRGTTKDEHISIAHVTAPPGWGEPFQRPDFDEYSLMVRGKRKIEIDGQEEVVLTAGESMLIFKGTRVRYSNPFTEEAEYWVICLPAFSLEIAHREEQ